MNRLLPLPQGCFLSTNDWSWTIVVSNPSAKAHLATPLPAAPRLWPQRSRFVFFFVLLVAFLLMPQIFVQSCHGDERTLEPIRLQLKWRHQFQFAGYYAAIEQGFFREAGFAVELLPGKTGLNPSDALLSGQAEFAVMSPSVLLERQQGQPLVVVSAIFQHSANVILTKREKGLLTPSDLAGKRVMITPETDPENLAMLANEGVPLQSLRVQPHTWSVEDLVAGKVDAQSAYLTNEPYLLGKQGVEPAMIKPVQYGIDFYGDCLVTTEHEVREHPERVEAFRRAVQRGWLYAMRHPEEIARLILARYSQEKSLAHLLFEAEAMRGLIRPDLVEIGYMNPDRWRHIADTYVQLGLMSPSYSLKGFLYAELQEEMAASKQKTLYLAAAILGGILLVGLGGGVVLMVFNTRLSREVDKRTAALVASEQNFRAFFELASVGVAQVDARSGQFRQVNKKYCEFVGYSEEEMQSLTFRDITHPEDLLFDRQQRRDLVAGAITEFTVEKRYLHKNGEVIWVIVTVSPLWKPGEQPDCSLAVVRDITKRKMAEEALVFATKVFEHSIEGIVVTDRDGKIMQVNPAFTLITGYSPEEAVGQNPRLLKSDRHDASFYQAMWAQLASEGQWSGEIWNRRKSGEIYPEWLTINAVRNSNGQITNYVSIFHDITELKRQQEALEHQAQHDALTGLPNRVLLNDRLQMALAGMKRRETKLAVMFLDLDHFKNINDGFGHTAGDNLLVELSRRLQEQLRAGDTLARQGGDEFLILLPEIESVEDAGLIATRLLASLQTPFFHGEIEYFVTASIGVTISPDDGNAADVLIKNADMAMYRAKNLGRNSYQLFTPELDALAHHRLSMESKLRKGIELEEFELQYQPLVSSRTGRILGAEALIRWRHGGALISPAEFIPLAEESGLILPLGEWVLRTAAGQAKKWQDAGYRLGLSVNISSRQFTGQDLAKLLREVLSTTGLEPGRLYFEITESMLMGDVGKAQRVLGELREEGGKFYLDDFGTGYSSLSYLKRLPLDGLKIDRSFIRDIDTDADSRAIVAAIVSLAKTLNLAIVAEGVETEAQLGILHAMSSMLIQGYLASRPVPAAEFERLLHQGHGLLPGAVEPS
jgi:diguanylate cyclase (GGDEF)-like protein/PAS domain S-box-containing protein